MSTIGIIAVLTYHSVATGQNVVDLSEKYQIEICENAEINKPCEMVCRSKCADNCLICFYHGKGFGEVSDICCSTYFNNDVGKACQIRRKRLQKEKLTLHVFTLDTLGYEHYGDWFCGYGEELSKKKLLEPFYLDLRRTALIPISTSPFRQLTLDAKNFVVPSKFVIYIPCAYPRPTITVTITTADHTCVLCHNTKPNQFLESCEIKGHIGSYNFTCEISRTSFSKTNLCLKSEHKLQVFINQRGRTTGQKMFSQVIKNKEKQVPYERLSYQKYRNLFSICILMIVTVLLLSIFLKYFKVIIAMISRGRPSAPIGPVRIIDVTNTSIKVRWNQCKVDYRSPLKHYVIECFSSGADRICVSTTETEHQFCNLEGNKTYMISVRSENQYGLSDCLNLENLVETKGRPSAPIGPLRIIDVTNTSIKVRWDQCKVDYRSPLKHFVIECFSSGADRICVSTTEIEHQFCNLVGNKTYMISVRSENQYGLSDCLNLENLVETKGRPSAPKGPLQVLDVTDKSMKIKWLECEYDGGDPIEHYEIECFSPETDPVYYTSTENEFILQPLLEKTNYMTSVRAKNQYGLSDRLYQQSFVVTKVGDKADSNLETNGTSAQWPVKDNPSSFPFKKGKDKTLRNQSHHGPRRDSSYIRSGGKLFLRLGTGITAENTGKIASLCVFVESYGQSGFLTSCSLFFDDCESIDFDSTYSEDKHYVALESSSKKRIGFLQRAIYRPTEKPVAVDVAFVKLKPGAYQTGMCDVRNPEELISIGRRAEETLWYTTGRTTTPKETNAEYVIKCGAGRGLTKGELCLDTNSKGQYQIKSFSGITFADEYDIGAPVFIEEKNKDLSCFGMLTSVSSETNIASVTPIGPLLCAINCTLCKLPPTDDS